MTRERRRKRTRKVRRFDRGANFTNSGQPLTPSIPYILFAIPHQSRPRFPFFRPFIKLVDCPYSRWGFFRPDRTRLDEMKRNVDHWNSRTAVKGTQIDKGNEKRRRSRNKKEKRNLKFIESIVQRNKRKTKNESRFARPITYDAFDFFVSSTGNRGLKSAELNGSVPNFFFPPTIVRRPRCCCCCCCSLWRFSTGTFRFGTSSYEFLFTTFLSDFTIPPSNYLPRCFVPFDDFPHSVPR